jgi:hypothetical protein
MTQARQHGEGQTNTSTNFSQMIWQSRYQDGNKDNIVDAEHDFQRCQGGQCDPCFRAAYPFGHILLRILFVAQYTESPHAM